MPQNNKQKKSIKTSSKKIDLLYISIGILTVGVIGLAIFNSPVSQNYAGAQTNPSSPGGGVIELPKSTSSAVKPEPVKTSPVIDVPTPDSPSINIEEIDEEGASTEIEVDSGGNLKPLLGNPETAIKPTTQNTPPTENNTTGETTKTVRSGGNAIWITILVIAGAGGAAYYYKKKGNRKSNFKMTEK